MKPSPFDPNAAAQDVNAKIVIGLERIAEAFKGLLWDKAKTVGLSPIQIQILLFIAYHKEDLCTVSHLAQEFNVTKPTVSDAIKVLAQKDMILKQVSATDSRSYTIALTPSGKEMVKETHHFAQPLQENVESMDENQRDELYAALHQLINQLNQTGILSVQRICTNCQFYQASPGQHYCNLLKIELAETAIQIDCPEHQPIPK